jgi:hypothetical protein
MNIVISEQLFRKLTFTVAEYEAELNETVKCLHAQEEIDSMEEKIIELQALGAFCRRIEDAAKHGRMVKGQTEPVQLTDGQLAQLKARK